jgi:hypothetical protein
MVGKDDKMETERTLHVPSPTHSTAMLTSGVPGHFKSSRLAVTSAPNKLAKPV